MNRTPHPRDRNLGAAGSVACSAGGRCWRRGASTPGCAAATCSHPGVVAVLERPGARTWISSPPGSAPARTRDPHRGRVREEFAFARGSARRGVRARGGRLRVRPGGRSAVLMAAHPGSATARSTSARGEAGGGSFASRRSRRAPPSWRASRAGRPGHRDAAGTGVGRRRRPRRLAPGAGRSPHAGSRARSSPCTFRLLRPERIASA